MEILRDIPVKLTPKAVLLEMHLRRENRPVTDIVRELIKITRVIARPKAIYAVACVENKNADSLDIGGARFRSRVLRVNLDKIDRVFPYVATCGRELDEVTIHQKT